MSKSYDQYCPMARTLDLLGDRWTLLIIRDLFRGKARFSEFVESLEGIPTNVLSERLKFLEAQGIIERSFYSDHPPRAEYSLTRKGKDLHWIVDAMYAWGSRHTFDEPVPGFTHAECGHPVAMAWHCSECGQSVRATSVKLEPITEHSKG